LERVGKKFRDLETLVLAKKGGKYLAFLELLPKIGKELFPNLLGKRKEPFAKGRAL